MRDLTPDQRKQMKTLLNDVFERADNLEATITDASLRRHIQQLRDSAILLAVGLNMQVAPVLGTPSAARKPPVTDV